MLRAAARPDVQPDSDAAVIMASGGNPERFGEIYRRHAATLHRYLARRVGVALADDLTADVFLAAFRSRHRYDTGASSALPWLYGIATNLLRRHRRTEQAQYRAWQRTGVDPTATDNHADAVTDRLSAEDTARHLGGVLAKLTTRERDVLLLVVWGGLSYDQTAAALRIPVGTVRSRLNRARQRLRAALEHPHRTGHAHTTEEST